MTGLLVFLPVNLLAQFPGTHTKKTCYLFKNSGNVCDPDPDPQQNEIDLKH